ncbi:hypothetical protein AMECASPLE_038103, partial [Ameca splendens]
MSAGPDLIDLILNQQPDRARDGYGPSEELKELELRVGALVEQGLFRVERSPSRRLVFQVVQQGAQGDTVRDHVDATTTSSLSPAAAQAKLQPPPPPPPPPLPSEGAVAQQTVGGS